MPKFPIVFLFGAGFSQAAGMESTAELTKKVLGHNWRFTDSIWRAERQSEVDKSSQRERYLLVFLARLVQRYYRRFNLYVEPNYEDLAYLAGQIEDGLLGEVDNPAVEPLIRDIETSLLTTLLRDEQEGSIDRLIRDLAGSARQLIYDLIWSSLNHKPPDMDKISFVSDSIQDTDISRCDIFSLNHDMVLESIFRQNSVEFSDGFGLYDETIRPWNPQGYDSEDHKTRLYKLHGGVNWVKYDGRLFAVSASRTSTTYVADLYGPNNRRPDNLRPELLIGTFDKALRYMEPHFLEMHCRLKQMLDRRATLVVCGYSFRDKGVNTQLVHWMLFNAASRMVIIHYNPTRLRDNARGAIQHNWNDWKSQGKLQIIHRSAEDVGWDKLKEALNTKAPYPIGCG